MNPPSEETLFEALSRLAPVERAASLEKACGRDKAMRERLEILLAAHDQANQFMAQPVAPASGGSRGLRIPLAERVGDKIGRYKLLQQIGEGGCGVVYMAEQEEPVRRRVALKVIKLGMDTRQVIARFEAERQALALMEHPNIAKVLDAGATDTGRPFFVMELVRGIKITDYCDQNQLSTAQRLDLFIQVCRAVQHAHQKGIIHRDLKPSNILVTVNDAVPVPKVIDFGIAKATQGRLTDKTLVTAFEQLIGTPAYMSPEQAVMTSQDIDTRTDIYSLGVLLYELLTGKTPFDTEQLLAAGLDEMRRTIREQQPERPSTRLTQELVATHVDPRRSSSGLGIPTQEEMSADSHRRLRLKEQIARVRGDLDWIVMKCLEKDRARRYETAIGLARDIERHLNNEPVAARPPSRFYEFQKTVRRHWVEFGAVAAVVVALSIGAVVSMLEAIRARRAEREQIHLREASQKAQVSEAEQRRRAEDGERYAQRLLYAAHLNLVQQAWEQDNIGRVRQLLNDTAAYPERGFEWYYWQRRAHQELTTLRAHSDEIASVAFSPDGRRIVSASSDQTVKVWDAATGTALLTLRGFRQAVISVAFSPDGKRIATGSGDQTARLWDATSGRELLTLEDHNDRVNSVCFSPDGRRVAAGNADGTARVWDAASGQELLTLQGHKAGVNSVAFSPDGQQIATGGNDRTARLWDAAASGNELFTLHGHRDIVNSVSFSPNGRRIVTTSNDRTAKVWDATSGRELLTLEGHRDGVNSAVFSPDGVWVITGSDDWTAKLWDAMTGREQFTFKGHNAKIYSVAVSADGQSMVTGSGDWTAKLWQVRDDLLRDVLMGHRRGSSRSGVLAVAFSVDGRRIVTGHADGSVKVWDAGSEKELLSFKGHIGAIASVAFSLDGQEILTAGLDGAVRVCDAASGKQLVTLRGNNAAVFSAAFSPDGQRIATARGDHTASIWDGVGGEELVRLEGHSQTVLSVAFSPNGRRIVTGSADHDAKVWDAITGKELLTLKGHPVQHRHAGRIWSAAFSPDGLKIVTGCEAATATVWDAATGKELVTLRGHSAGIMSAAFSPNAQRIVTGSWDHTAKVWDTISGEELLTFKGHAAPIRAVAFSPDGSRILTGSQDDTARLWETATAAQVAAWRTREAEYPEHAGGVPLEQADAADHQQPLQAQDPGMIKQWLMLSPIPYSGESGANALSQQQIPDESNIHPRVGQRIKVKTADRGERVWSNVQLPDHLIDFNDLAHYRAEWCVGYAVCYVQSDAEWTNLCIKVGSDDQSKVYLNGKEIYRNEKGRSYVPDQDIVTGVELRAGFNVLVFKVVNEMDQWLGSIRFTDAAGKPLKGIRVTLDPDQVR